MFKRLKTAWKISKTSEGSVLDLIEHNQRLVDEKKKMFEQNSISIGDGKAEFFGTPTPEEELQFERQEKGTDKWYKRILG